MIAEIRDYFRGVITTIDGDLKEHDQPLISDNIADTMLESTYFLSIGETSIDRKDVISENTTSVRLELYKNGYNNELENYDNAYCSALSILRSAINQETISQSQMVKAVNASGVVPELIENNDNAYRFSIQFTVKTYF